MFMTNTKSLCHALGARWWLLQLFLSSGSYLSVPLLWVFPEAQAQGFYWRWIIETEPTIALTLCA